MTDDFGPAWGIVATVDPFASLADLSPVTGRWSSATTSARIFPVVHWNETQDKPFALVTYREEDWALTVSHEVLEMLADPLGKEFATGPVTVARSGNGRILDRGLRPLPGSGLWLCGQRRRPVGLHSADLLQGVWRWTV